MRPRVARVGDQSADFPPFYGHVLVAAGARAGVAGVEVFAGQKWSLRYRQDLLAVHAAASEGCPMTRHGIWPAGRVLHRDDAEHDGPRRGNARLNRGEGDRWDRCAITFTNS